MPRLNAADFSNTLLSYLPACRVTLLTNIVFTLVVALILATTTFSNMYHGTKHNASDYMYVPVTTPHSRAMQNLF